MVTIKLCDSDVTGILGALERSISGLQIQIDQATKEDAVNAKHMYLEEQRSLETIHDLIQDEWSNKSSQCPEGRITLSARITDYLSCANHHADKAADAELAGKHNLYEWHSGAYLAYTIVVHDLQVYEAQEAQLRNETVELHSDLHYR